MDKIISLNSPEAVLMSAVDKFEKYNYPRLAQNIERLRDPELREKLLRELCRRFSNDIWILMKENNLENIYIEHGSGVMYVGISKAITNKVRGELINHSEALGKKWCLVCSYNNNDGGWTTIHLPGTGKDTEDTFECVSSDVAEAVELLWMTGSSYGMMDELTKDYIQYKHLDKWELMNWIYKARLGLMPDQPDEMAQIC